MKALFNMPLSVYYIKELPLFNRPRIVIYKCTVKTSCHNQIHSESTNYRLNAYGKKNVNLESILGTLALKTKPRKILNNEIFKTLATQTSFKLLKQGS
jgi:hypothetical protein